MISSPFFKTSFACLLATSLSFGDVVTPVSATSNIDGDAGSSVDWLLAENPARAEFGIQDEFGALTTLDTGDTTQKAVCTFALRGGGGHQQSWTRPIGEGNPIFIFDLSGGGDLSIGSVILWQYGNNGGPGPTNGGNATRDFSLIFHTEAEGDTFDFDTEATEFSDTMEPIYGDETLDNHAQPFFFGAQETARYVALRIDNNYLPPADPIITLGGDRYGLAEVRFATEDSVDPLVTLPDAIVIENNGAPETILVTVTNDGATQNLTVTDARIEGLDASGFSIITDFTSPLVIAPGASADIEIAVDPTQLLVGTPIEASLEVDSDGWFKPTVITPITGLVRDPWIDSVPEIDLGTILPTVGVQNFSIDIENLGTTFDLNVSGAFTTTFEFEVTDDLDANPLVIAPGETGTINLSFDSGGLAGVFSDTLEIDSDDLAETTRVVDLTVTVERDPEISVPAVVNIGPFASGSGPQTFSIQVDNIGASNDLTFPSDPILLASDDDLNFSVDSFDPSIAAGANGNINLTFDPMGNAGDFVATLEIESNDLGQQFTEVQIVANVAVAPAPGDLVAWWTMDDESDPGKDSSANGFDGDTIGLPTTSAGANGNTGSSLTFDGARIDVPWSSALNGTSFTVTLWACPTVNSGHNSLITSRDDAPGSTHGYILYTVPNGDWSFWTGDGNPGWNELGGGASTLDTWTHIAISYDEGTETKSIYVNGVLVDSTTGPGQYDPNGPQMEALHIAGGADDGASFPFTGKIDDVAVFASALSGGDISTIMNEGVAGFLTPGAAPMEIEIAPYTVGSGMVELTISNIPADETFHLRSSTDGQTFDPLTPAIDFDENTAQPMAVPVDPAAVPVLLLRAYEGPSAPGG